MGFARKVPLTLNLWERLDFDGVFRVLRIKWAPGLFFRSLLLFFSGMFSIMGLILSAHMELWDKNIILWGSCRGLK